MGSLGQETQEASGQPPLDLEQNSAPSARRCRRPRRRILLLAEARDDLTPIPARSKLSWCRPKPGHLFLPMISAGGGVQRTVEEFLAAAPPGGWSASCKGGGGMKMPPASEHTEASSRCEGASRLSLSTRERG